MGSWQVNNTEAGGVLPHMGYIGMCSPKGYCFLAVLVRNKVSISGSLALNKVWFWVCFSEEATFSSLSIRPSTNVIQNAFNIGRGFKDQVINRLSIF